MPLRNLVDAATNTGAQLFSFLLNSTLSGETSQAPPLSRGTERQHPCSHRNIHTDTTLCLLMNYSWGVMYSSCHGASLEYCFTEIWCKSSAV